VLRGDWLKALGFPIDAPIHLTCDTRGEVTLYRAGCASSRRIQQCESCTPILRWQPRRLAPWLLILAHARIKRGAKSWNRI